jgi:hypothetical protein
MREDQGVAPTVADLRPVRPPNPTFPVYADLVELLSRPDPGLVPAVDPVPHVLAVAAAYSYASDVGTLATLMTRLGLEECTCYTVSEAVDALLIDAHAALVQSRDGSVVLLAFRGTPPMGAISWLIDIDTSPQNIVLSNVRDDARTDAGHQVHAGFYRNVRSIRYAVLDALLRARAGRSVVPDGPAVEHPMQHLYITGHSLGGAMACLFTVMLRADPSERARELTQLHRATCTFGQPMVGTTAFSAEARRRGLGGRFARYVYRKDPVVRCPPRLAGTYAHFGMEYRYGESWSQPGPLTRQSAAGVIELAALPEAAMLRRTVLRRIPLPGPSLDDHNPQNYVTALTPEGKPNEYGDDFFAP